MESFDYVKEQDTYRGKCYVYFTGLYYRLVGEDGIYYCKDCFFAPLREQNRMNELERLREERKIEMERRRRLEAAERLRREEERLVREQESRRRREQEERSRRELQRRLRREQEELRARERIQRQEAESRNLLGYINKRQRERLLENSRESDKVFVLKSTEEKVQAIDEERIQKNQEVIFSNNEISEFNEFTKRKQQQHEICKVDTEFDESDDSNQSDEYGEDDKGQELDPKSGISEEMLRKRLDFLHGIEDTNEKTLLYMVTITQLARYSEKNAEVVTEVLWSHKTLNELELLLGILCDPCLYSKETTTVTHVEWIQQLLEKLSVENSSMFYTAHMKWVEQQCWENQREVEDIFRYLHSDDRAKSWSSPQIWRLSKIIQTSNSKKVLAWLRLIPQFAISSQSFVGSECLLDFLQKNVPSSPKCVSNALQKHFLDEKDMKLDDLLSIIDACPNEKEKYRRIVETVLETITRCGYPGHLKSFHEYKKELQLKKESMWDSLSLTALVIFKRFGYWPRVSQLLSCVVMLEKQKDSGRLLQIQTGEGKSTVIAIVAAVMAMNTRKVDVITSSPVLATRDSKEWENFYAELDLKVAENITCQDDKEKKAVYCADVVYGTVSSFSGDILRNDFLTKDIRPHRKYELVIVDEVDSMLVDNGVQFNYLSHNLASSGLRHLEPLLALIWKAVSDHAPVITEAEEVLFRGNPEPFHMILYNLADDSDKDDSWSPAKLIQFAHERLHLFTKKDVADWQSFSGEEIVNKVKGVSEDQVISFFEIARSEFQIPFVVYRLNDDGVAEPSLTILDHETDEEVQILVLGNGQACRLNGKETLHNGIEQFVLHRIPENEREEVDDQIKIPSYLVKFARRKVNAFVGNAFVALSMRYGREYTIRDGNVLPIDFKSTGVIEKNKKWGDGLQQFLEMKHRLRISALGLVTNFMSNLFFFQKYGTNILGVSGTLGTDADKEFMKEYYKVKKFYIMPSNKTKKLLTNPGILLNDELEWKKSVINTIKDVIASRRAILIICEDITTVEIVREEVEEARKKQLRSKIPIIYAESDNAKQMERIKEEVSEGSIIIATNLAGRGTDIKVSDTVSINGGLFVLLTFLPANRRVELQASGRAGRKGQPGSSHVILNRNQLPMYLRVCTEIEEVRLLRDEMEHTRIRAMKDDIAIVLVKESLFEKYCKMIKQSTNEELDESYRNRTLNSLHETWALWLDDNKKQVKSKSESLLCSKLEEHLGRALQLLQEENLSKSPNENVYHVLLHGAEMIRKCNKNAAKKAFQVSLGMGIYASSIAHYNMAYSLIEQDGKNNLVDAQNHLQMSQKSLKHYKEDILIIKELVDHSYTCEKSKNEQKLLKDQSYECEQDEIEQYDFNAYISTRVQFLQFWEKNILEAIEKIKELSEKEKEAEVKPGGIFSLVNDPDEFMDDTLNEFFQMGLLLVFTVKEKPKFSWGALAVFFIGLLQVAAGAILIAVTAGTATNIGMGLISEGVSDVIEGVEGMVKGTFDWASWGISKAINLGTSLLVGGVGKFLKGGASAVKGSIKQGISRCKQVLKSSKTVLGTKGAMRESLKQTGKVVGKKVADHSIMYVVEKVGDVLLEEVMKSIIDEVKSNLQNQLKKDVLKEPLQSSLLALLPEEEGPLSLPAITDCVAAARKLADTTVAPYYESSTWKEKVSSALQETLKMAKSNFRDGKYKAIFGAIKAATTISEITKTVEKLSSLCENFTTDLRREVDESTSNKNKRKRSQSRNGTPEQEQKFLCDVACELSDVLGDAISSIIRQGASKHLTKLARKNIKKCFRGFTRDKLNTEHTEKKIKSANAAFQISHCTGKTADYNGVGMGGAKDIVMKFAENIVKDKIKGGLSECKVLADHLGKNISIYKSEDGNIMEHRQVSSNSKSAANEPPVKLLYHPPSSKFPDGHYETLDEKNAGIPNLSASEGASCLFEAVYANLNPESLKSGKEIANGAEELRHKVVLQLQTHPGRYAEHIEKYEFNKRLGKLGQWYMGIGGTAIGNPNGKKAKEAGTHDKSKTGEKRNGVFTKDKESQEGGGMSFSAGRSITEQTKSHVDNRFVHFYEILYIVANERAMGTNMIVRPAKIQDHTGALKGRNVGTNKKADKENKGSDAEQGKAFDEQCRDGQVQLVASYTTAFYPDIQGLAAGGETKSHIDTLTSRKYLSPTAIKIGQGRDIDKWQIHIAANVLSCPENSKKFLADFNKDPMETFKAHLNESVAYEGKTHQTLESRLRQKAENSQGSSRMVSYEILAAIDKGKAGSGFKNRLENVRPYEATP